jgi:non-specific serine/threonine protein kinase/serine/threonine-protein kinase
MSEPSWADVRAVFETAAELTGDARDAYLATHATDPALRREVLSLLAVDTAAARFEQPLPIMLAPPEPETPLPADHRVGPYAIVRVIGRGGMGVVYLGRRADDAYHREVAIKVVRPGPDAGGLAARFAHERQTLAALTHPNIARLYDGGTTEQGAPYFVMEFVDGGPVDAYCDAQRLTVDQRLDLFRTICAGVQYAHENFIVHRDIKPDNILIARDGTPKLLDFGVAKLLTDDTPADGRGPAPTWWMTPDYASPEQLAARAAVTTASDVYSLGVLLHVLLTGVRPYDFAGGPPSAIQAQLAEAVLMPLSRRVREDTDGAQERALRRGTTPRDLSARLSGDLDAIVARALSRDVATRYPTVDRLARDLDRHRTGHPVEARRRDPSYVARRFVRRHALALALTAGVLVLLTGAVAALWRQAGIAARERDLAQRRFEDVRQLAHTFLFDVHDAVASVPGTTKARALMVQTATDYLQKLARDAHDNVPLRRELASAFLKVGDAQGLGPADANLGNYAGAVESYRRAIEIAGGLVSAPGEGGALPADPRAAADEPQLTLARAHRRMADVLPLLGDKATALTHSETSLRLYTARAARPGATADDRMQVCLGEMKLGDLLGNPQSANLGRPADALHHFELGVACMRALTAAAPDDLRMRRNLAATLQRIGGMHEAAGHWSEAERVYGEVFALVQTIAAAAAASGSSAPLPPQLQRDVAVGYGTLARVQRATGRLPEAVANYREVLARFERIVRDDPSDAAGAHGVAVNQELLGGTLAEAGQVAEGVRLVEQAVAANRRLIAADATKVEARCDLAHALEALGDARRHQPGPRPTPEACRAWEESASILKAALAARADACEGPAPVERLSTKLRACD